MRAAAWSVVSVTVNERQIGIEVIIPRIRGHRKTMPKTLPRLIAKLRNRAEVSFQEITDQMNLARHGAHTFEGSDQDRCHTRVPHPAPHPAS